MLTRTTYVKEAAAAKNHVQQVAQSLNSIVERELDKRFVLAQTLASTNAVRDGDFRRFHQEATAATKGSGGWAVLLEPRRVVANTLTPFNPEGTPRLSDVPLTQAGPMVVYVPRGQARGNPAVTVFAAVPDVHPQVYNVGVSFAPDVIQALIPLHEVPAGGIIAVANADQRIMARSRDPDKWLGQQGTPEATRRLATGDAGFAESVTVDGVRSISYQSSRNRYGWRVVVGLPQATLAATARELTMNALAAVGALLLIGLAIALWGARGVSDTVLALRTAAMELGRHRLPPRLRTGVSEVDEVSDALHAAGLESQQATLTLERRVEEAVQRAHDAQSKLLEGQKHEAIGRLTGGIAHDFNNLLQTITTALQLVHRQAAEGREKRVLQGALRASSKAADLVKQLLVFGRTQPLQPQVVGLNDLVLRTQELTSKAVGERIVLTAQVEAHLPALFVDPVQLELAFLNLIFNARDAMPQGGNIALVGRRALPSEAPQPNQEFVCIEVSDDGSGMDAETQRRAFEPYYTTKSIGAGSGLGLAQVQGFARQSGGDVKVWSVPGEGTRVTMILPATDAPVQAAPEAAPIDGAAAHAPLRILMVEDDILVSSVVAPALEAEGHRVALCQRADDAVPILQSDMALDVVFTDVMVPGSMNGLDLLAWCREHRPELPVVVTSGYFEASQGITAEVVRKPYSVEDVIGRLRKATSATVAAR